MKCEQSEVPLFLVEALKCWCMILSVSFVLGTAQLWGQIQPRASLATYEQRQCGEWLGHGPWSEIIRFKPLCLTLQLCDLRHFSVLQFLHVPNRFWDLHHGALLRLSEIESQNLRAEVSRNKLNKHERSGGWGRRQSLPLSPLLWDLGCTHLPFWT